MTDIIPQWITNLAIDIYKVIQQYDAMAHFQHMVQEWGEDHEHEIQNEMEWKKKRDQHFEQNVLKDARLQEKDAGAPETGWQWETHVLLTYEESESGLDSISRLTFGWVPPELSMSSKPEITHLLPLSRQHELTVPEKYTVLAAIYDCGRKGTPKLPPWQWPENWNTPNALSNAKKCIFFEVLCKGISELKEPDEGWLRVILDDVRRELSTPKEAKPPGPQSDVEKTPSETLVDKWLRRARNHRAISIIILICIVIIGLGAVTRSLDDVWSFVGKIVRDQSDSRAPQQDLSDTRILTATATVEITIAFDKKEGKTTHIVPGNYLAFRKGRDALLVMSSTECTSEQTGKNTLRYYSTLSLEPTSRALNQPLSMLKETEYVQICLEPMPSGSHVLSGKALCVFNGDILMEIPIKPQQMTGEVIIIRHIDIAFEEVGRSSTRK